MSGLGITAGAHRLWAHKSYKVGNTGGMCLTQIGVVQIGNTSKTVLQTGTKTFIKTKEFVKKVTYK